MKNVHAHKPLRISLLTLFSLIFNCASFATPIGTIRDSFDIFRWYIEMTITPDNNLYLLDNEYGVFKADMDSKIWKHILNGDYKELIITGENNLFVSTDFSDNILHSQDKGQTWEKISAGESASIYKMCSDNEKHVWILDYRNNIYFTENNGKSWTKDSIFKHAIEGINDCDIKNIQYDKEDKSLWIITEDNHRTRPMLFRSVDKGLSFAQIPTPADQIKDYDKKAATGWINISSDEDYYYVHQNNIVCKTRKDHIEWEIVNEEKTKQLQFPDCYGRIIGRCSKNDTIWFYTDNGYLCNYHDGEITATKMSTEKPINIYQEEKDTLYNSMTYYNGIYYYAGYKSIYCKDGNSENWYRYLDSDKDPQYVWKDHNGVYMSDKNFNKYQINQEIDSIKPYISDFNNLKDKQIKKITFIKGSTGCFHNVKTELSYKNKRGHFSKAKKTVTGKKDYFLKDMPRRIDKSSTDKFLQFVYRSMCNLNDTINLELIENERQYYKKIFDEEIEISSMLNMDTIYIGHEYHPIYNIIFRRDFDITTKKDIKFLSSCVDTLKIDKNTQQTILTEENYSVCTTTNYNLVQIIMNDNSSLNLQDYNYEPNYLHCPWIAFYNGEPFLLKSLAVGKSIDDMTNGKFMPECNTKEYAIGKILRYYLYNQKQ